MISGARSHAIVTALPAATRNSPELTPPNSAKALELDPANFWANETLALIYAYQEGTKKKRITTPAAHGRRCRSGKPE